MIISIKTDLDQGSQMDRFVDYLVSLVRLVRISNQFDYGSRIRESQSDQLMD
jgi:hypothetical protein